MPSAIMSIRFYPSEAGLLSAANFFVSLVLIAVLFATIYKVLPDRPLAWRDVLIGAVGTTGPVRSRKMADCALYRQQRDRLQLWRGRGR